MNLKEIEQAFKKCLNPGETLMYYFNDSDVAVYDIDLLPELLEELGSEASTIEVWAGNVGWSKNPDIGMEYVEQQHKFLGSILFSSGVISCDIALDR